jgi:hypothetical protein
MHANTGVSLDAPTRLYRRVGSQIRRVHFGSLHWGLRMRCVCRQLCFTRVSPKALWRVPSQVRRLHIRWRNPCVERCKIGSCLSHTSFVPLHVDGFRKGAPNCAFACNWALFVEPSVEPATALSSLPLPLVRLVMLWTAACAVRVVESQKLSWWRDVWCFLSWLSWEHRNPQVTISHL